MGRLNRLPTSLRQVPALVLAAGAVTLFSGFDWGLHGPQSTISAEGPVAQSQLNLFYVTLFVTAGIFVCVGGALAYTQFKFRARKGDENREPPAQTHGHPLIEVGLIVVSTLLLVIIAIPTVRGIWYMNDTPDRENALVVKVTGYQWWFNFEYPDLGVVAANEMVIPTGRPVHIELRTGDVIHSFWVPKLAGKVDLMPNRANHMWLQADQANYYWAQCAEYCGESHAKMKFRVISLDEPEFTAWVEHQKSDARTIDPAAAAAAASRPRAEFAAQSDATDIGFAGSESPFAYWQEKQAEPTPGSEDVDLITSGGEVFKQRQCIICHSIRGSAPGGNVGPDLTHFGSRTTLAGAALENTPENLHRWLIDPHEVKPGNIMWRDAYIESPSYNTKYAETLTAEDIDALVAYLSSLK